MKNELSRRQVEAMRNNSTGSIITAMKLLHCLALLCVIIALFLGVMYLNSKL